MKLRINEMAIASTDSIIRALEERGFRDLVTSHFKNGLPKEHISYSKDYFDRTSKKDVNWEVNIYPYTGEIEVTEYVHDVPTSDDFNLSGVKRIRTPEDVYKVDDWASSIRATSWEEEEDEEEFDEDDYYDVDEEEFDDFDSTLEEDRKPGVDIKPFYKLSGYRKLKELGYEDDDEENIITKVYPSGMVVIVDKKFGTVEAVDENGSVDVPEDLECIADFNDAVNLDNEAKVNFTRVKW